MLVGLFGCRVEYVRTGETANRERSDTRGKGNGKGEEIGERTGTAIGQGIVGRDAGRDALRVQSLELRKSSLRVV